MRPHVEEQFDVVRRLLERGKRLAEGPGAGDNAPDAAYVDIFVHCLEQLARLRADCESAKGEL